MKFSFLSIGVIIGMGFALTPIWAQGNPPEAPPVPRVEEVLKTRPGNPPDTTRIFLVAGSSLTVNFAQEIIDQKRIWLGKGIPDSQIACYYVLPAQDEFEEERKQYTALASDLKDCFPASVKQLRENLARTARKKPPYIYLYITSHGRQPISEKIKILKRSDPNFFQFQYLARYEVLNQYSLDIESLPDGPAGPYELLGAYRGGMPPEDIFLTPRYLFQFLKREFPDTPKFLVLQGCFSGGFLVDPRKERWDTLLTNLNHVMVLTASRHNRESFGCGPGSSTTYFGEVFNKLLEKMGSTPPEIDWPKFQAAIKEAITALEKKIGVREPSNPIYFSNQTGNEEFY
jgi:hypothetical protein